MIRSRLTLLSSLLLIACTDVPVSDNVTALPTEDRKAGWPHGAMVSAANPAAVDTAIGVLERGGHAVDAAIAAHAVLGLVEPESSGLGGSAFMLVYDRGTDALVVFDGRETAPAAASPEMFEFDEGTGFIERWPMGTMVGVPGAVAVYEAAHERYGRSKWAALFDPAIRLANDGFEVTEKFVRYNDRLAEILASGAHATAAEYLFPGGEPLVAGARVENPAYAITLRRIAAHGAAGFYGGATAQVFVERARLAPRPSTMTVDDLARYEVVVREPVCGRFRVYRICSVPPPSSGLAQISIAVLYDELLAGDEDSLDDKLQVFVDAQRLAYADRDHFIADPAFADVPVEELIDPVYLEHRATQRFEPFAAPEHGDPLSVIGMDEAAHNTGTDRTTEAVGTTHLSIIDGDGNAVAMTASVGFPYGSVHMTDGFFLNNELTDFSRGAPDEAEPANVAAAGKRPRSSMSPTIVFDEDGEPLLLTGSAGGSSIIAYTAKTILGILDWGLSPQAAADFPNIVARGRTIGVEVAVEGGQEIADELSARGYEVNESRGENSGLHVIFVRPDGMQGAADSRRHGTVGTIEPARDLAMP